jgi:hypothetical protein
MASRRRGKCAARAALPDADMFSVPDMESSSSEEEQDVETRSAASGASKASKRASSSKSTSVGGGLVVECGMPKCAEPARKGRKWCGVHQKHYDNRRYDVEHSKQGGSKDKQTAWIDRCKLDRAFTINEIADQESKNAGVGKWMKSNKQYQSFSWQEDHGLRIANKSGVLIKPWEEGQWKIAKQRDFGWSESKANSGWLTLFSQSWEKNFKGENGTQRLWLPDEYKDQAKEKYEDFRAHVGSEVLKDPSETDAQALLDHVHTRSNYVDNNSEFLQGRAKAIAQGSDIRGEKRKREVVAESASREVDDEERDQDDSNDEEPPVKKLKGNITTLKSGQMKLMTSALKNVTPPACLTE